MGVIIFIIVIGIFIYLITKGSTNDTSDYEFSDDWDEYESTWESDYEEPTHEYQESDYPLFDVLQNSKEVYDFISPELIDLTKTLSLEKSENVQSSLNTLLYQDKFRENKNLPEYLKVVPITKLISKNIFVNPDESNIHEVLNSMTMVILKEYCNELEIKPGKSKKDTIDKLLESNITPKINLGKYFKLNPQIKELNKQVGKYFQTINEKLLDKRKVVINNIKKPLDPDSLREIQSHGEYKLQKYGSSYIYFKNEKSLFKICTDVESGSSIYDHNILLLNNGMIFYSIQSSIGQTIMTKSYLIDEKKDFISQFKIKDISETHYLWNDIIEVNDKPIICIKISENQYWTLNYDKIEERIIDNPDSLDIYSLLDD